MYPLLDSTTLNRRAVEASRAAEKARRTKAAHAGAHDVSGRGVRYAVGSRLVRAGLRLIEA